MMKVERRVPKDWQDKNQRRRRDLDTSTEQEAVAPGRAHVQAHNHNDRDAQHRSGDDDGRWPQAFYRKERDRIMRNISRAHGREEDEPQDHWCKHVPSVDALPPPKSPDNKVAQCVQRAGELLYVPEGWYQ